MKYFNATLVFVLLVQANASFAGNTVFEKSIPDESSMSRRPRAQFMVNLESPELKRGWLRISYDESILMDDESPLPKAVDIAVPGLTYAPDSKEIIFTKADGTKIVCADKVEKGFFKNFSYNDTRKCLVDIGKTTLSEDNGFFVKKTAGLKISFILRD